MDLSCGECNVIDMYFMCCSVNGSVCLVCCVFDSVCELFGEIYGSYMMFVKIMLAMCMLVSVKADSVSSIHCFQLAFL